MAHRVLERMRAELLGISVILRRHDADYLADVVCRQVESALAEAQDGYESGASGAFYLLWHLKHDLVCHSIPILPDPARSAILAEVNQLLSGPKERTPN